MSQAELSDAWRVCGSDELPAGAVLTRLLRNDAEGLPIVAMILRDEAGVIRAYRNLCRHLAVPLDGGTGELMNKKRTHLVCGTHGAIYRLRDGYCIEGPCEGLSLFALRCEERADGIYVTAEPLLASPKS